MNEPANLSLRGQFARWRDRLEAAQWPYYLAYLLPFTPFLTDLDETGHFPLSAREWTTEVVLGLLIFLLVRRIHHDYLHAHAVARTDALTGLGNRRAFELALEDEMVRSVRQGQPLCLVYIDLDKFKAINDCYGHAAGDQVLQAVAGVIAKVIRSHVDMGFRLGGDEFALLLPGSTLEEAMAVLARIRERCSHVGRGPALQISVGACQLLADETLAGFVKRADAAMYAEKNAAAGSAP